MIAANGRDYNDLPHLTASDEDFRSKFLSWDLGNISYTDVQEYLKGRIGRRNNPRIDGET